MNKNLTESQSHSPVPGGMRLDLSRNETAVRLHETRFSRKLRIVLERNDINQKRGGADNETALRLRETKPVSRYQFCLTSCLTIFLGTVGPLIALVVFVQWPSSSAAALVRNSERRQRS